MDRKTIKKVVGQAILAKYGYETEMNAQEFVEKLNQATGTYFFVAHVYHKKNKLLFRCAGFFSWEYSKENNNYCLAFGKDSFIFVELKDVKSVFVDNETFSMIIRLK